MAGQPQAQQARLVINGSDMSAKLRDFSLSCRECGSREVTLDIDWAAYPSASWCRVVASCDQCKADETIYDVG